MWNMFKINTKDTRTTPMASFWCLYCWLWTYFTPCSRVSIPNFAHVTAGWETFFYHRKLLPSEGVWSRKKLFIGVSQYRHFGCRYIFICHYKTLPYILQRVWFTKKLIKRYSQMRWNFVLCTLLAIVYITVHK